MRYGVLFGITSLILFCYSYVLGGYYYILIWAAVSFGIIALGYFCLGPKIYGKNKYGLIKCFCVAILLPYLIYLWSLWHLLRLIKKEAAYNKISDNLYIGRRLLNNEVPSDIDIVVDLTCEFTEPLLLRSKEYYSFQILDASVPKIDEIQKWYAQIKAVEGKIYIHCAEGHGRTGLFAAFYLMCKENITATEAINLIQLRRPMVKLNKEQQKFLLSLQNAGCPK